MFDRRISDGISNMIRVFPVYVSDIVWIRFQASCLVKNIRTHQIGYGSTQTSLLGVDDVESEDILEWLNTGAFFGMATNVQTMFVASSVQSVCEAPV